MDDIGAETKTAPDDEVVEKYPANPASGPCFACRSLVDPASEAPNTAIWKQNDVK